VSRNFERASMPDTGTLGRSVSILEEGGRLGLKCLLLSYFRVGDHSELGKGRRKSVDEMCAKQIRQSPVAMLC
jgi:hypothetical protein